MSMLKKPEATAPAQPAAKPAAPAKPVPGPIANPDTPDALAPHLRPAVQTGVKIQTKLPPDPLRVSARLGDGGVKLGLYKDNSGGTYMVICAADGFVTYGRLDGGHAMQIRTIPVEEFSAHDRGGRPIYQKVLPAPEEDAK